MNRGARLKPGQTPEEASALLRALQPQIRAATLPSLNPEGRAQYLAEPMTFVAAPAGRPALRRARVTLRRGAGGTLALPQPLRASADDDPGSGQRGAADRLRQHRQPAD